MCENKNLTIRNEKRHKVFNVLLTVCIPIWLLSFGFPLSGLFGQTPGSTMDQLKEGTVIFIIPTESEKLKHLRAESDRARNDKQAAKLALREEETRAEVDSFARALSQAVQAYFTYAKYELVPDTLLRQRLAKDDTERLFLVRRGTTESGADALILNDRDLTPLQRPVPYFARLARLSSIFDAFFGSVRYGWRDLDDVIGKWSERLEKWDP